MTANFGATTYDWANMLDTYTEGQYSDTQAKAVATLMLHCGIAAQMNYSSTGSGTGNYKACNALKQYFNYHSNIKSTCANTPTKKNGCKSSTAN